MYYIGDKVKIKSRQGMEDDYPCTYVDNMSNVYAGRITTIVDVTRNVYVSSEKKERKFFNGDTTSYRLDIDDQIYSWDSSIFENIKDIVDIEEDVIDTDIFLSEEIFEIQDKCGFFKTGLPVIVNGRKLTIVKVDETDNEQPYKFSNDCWIEKDDQFCIDFLKILESRKECIFESKIFGKMIISLQENTEYPIIAKLSDGDILELTSDFKYFKNSKNPII